MRITRVLGNFLKGYLELPQDVPKIACLGGGTGLSTLLSGLKDYSNQITAIVTMCDEGGSSGRLRRTLGVPPVGDIRNCLAVLSESSEVMGKLLNYRFAGDRYGADRQLGGHSLGNLLLVALTDITGDFNKALAEAGKILKISGKVLPSTEVDAHIWAETENGQKVVGEENIDLGRYDGKRTIKKLHLTPAKAAGFKPALFALRTANIITAGPGDLYTSIMPNLLISDIKNEIAKSTSAKILIVNIANKPFETPNYLASDYLKAIERHCTHILFNHILVNTNHTQPLPKQLGYHYVEVDYENLKKFTNLKVIAADLVNRNFPLHHNPNKLAKAVISVI